jgi:carbon monoxide dehydrogenase subunit G
MPEAHGTITIQRPVAEVFDFVADHTNDHRWRPGVIEMTYAGNKRWHQRVRGPGGREIPASIEETQREDNRLLVFRGIEGPVRPEGRYEFTADGDATRVTFDLRAELGGLKKLMAPMVRKQMNAEVGNLENLKRVLELH